MSALGNSFSRTLVVLTLTATLVAAPVSADAGSRRHPDPRGDMVTGESSPAPDQVNGDIVKVRLRHTHNRIRVRFTLADLARGDTIVNNTNVSVATNEGVRRYVNSAAWAGHWQGEPRMNRRDGTPVRCAIHQSNNYVANVVVIGFSRRCVKDPRWVRISAKTSTAVSFGDGMGGPPIYIDDGLSQGRSAGSTTLSPRIRRG